MPRHIDAIGYLQDLGTGENLPWFQMICDIVTLDGQTALSYSDINCLYALFTGNASYLPQTGPTTIVTAPN
jgi:hypothetical protein